MSKVLSYLKAYRFFMVIAIALMLLELVVELVQPLLLAKIIDDGIMQEDLTVVWKWGAIMLGFSFLAFVAGIVNSFFAAHVSQGFGYDLRLGLYKKIQSFAFANFNLFPTASLITRMTNDVTQIQNTIFMSLRIMLRAPMLVLGGVVMAFIVNAKIASILVIAVPFLVIFLLWLLKKGRGYFSQVQQKLDNVNKIMRENLSGIRLIKAFIRRKHEEERFTSANEELKAKTTKALRMMELTMPILLFVMNLGILAVLWFGGLEVNTGNASEGEVVAIINYATRITSSFSIFSMIIMVFSRARASTERISEVLEAKVDLMDDKEVAATEAEQLNGKIAFQAVSFSYPNTTRSILSDINFEVQPGEMVAILGETGAGKTSLFQLIPRLYEASAGNVLVDDIDVRDRNQTMLRKQIGYVPQESLLFTGTVRDNIAYGKENATIEEIMEAAKHAQIHEKILQLPMQYDTKIGQKGVNLSGGQKQRLSIARALLIQPKILLLDDSTSALDLQTEQKLLDVIKKYTCTTFIITQKISTAQKADTIFILEDGKLIGTGTHEELLSYHSHYQKIYRSQFGEEGEGC